MNKKLVKVAIAASLAGGLLFGALAQPRDADAAPDPVAAIILSASMSGVGEWYNSGFSGGFPIVECILGKICPCIAISSIIDGAAGKTDDGLRFNFWSSPN